MPVRSVHRSSIHTRAAALVTEIFFWIVCGGLLLWFGVVLSALLFLKRKDPPKPPDLPFVSLDGKHPELEAELELEKQERMNDMTARTIGKFLNRF